eukprot:14493830-Alexandrium_andersonii.AAC.1
MPCVASAVAALAAAVAAVAVAKDGHCQCASHTMRTPCCTRWSLPMCELDALTACRGNHKMAHANVRHNRWADRCKMDFANAQPARAVHLDPRLLFRHLGGCPITPCGPLR